MYFQFNYVINGRKRTFIQILVNILIIYVNYDLYFS